MSDSNHWTPLLEVIDRAISVVGSDQYRINNRPTFEDRSAVELCKQQLMPIMKILGHGWIVQEDYISDIEWRNDCLYVRKAWSTRGIERSLEYMIPRDVLADPNPVRAANIHIAREIYQQAKQQVATANRKLDEAAEALQQLGGQIDVDVRVYYKESLADGIKLALKHRLYVPAWGLVNSLKRFRTITDTASKLVLVFVDDIPIALAWRETDNAVWDYGRVLAYCKPAYRRRGYGSLCVRTLGPNQHDYAEVGGVGSEPFWNYCGVKSSLAGW